MEQVPSTTNSVTQIGKLAADVVAQVPPSSTFTPFFAILDTANTNPAQFTPQLTSLLNSAVSCCYVITSRIEVAKTAFQAIIDGIKRQDAKKILSSTQLLERCLVEPAQQVKIIGEKYLTLLDDIRAQIATGESAKASKENWLMFVRVAGIVLTVASLVAPLASNYLKSAQVPLTAFLALANAANSAGEEYLVSRIGQIQDSLTVLANHEANMQEQHNIWQELQQLVAQFNVQEAQLQRDVSDPELATRLPAIQQQLFAAVTALSGVSRVTAQFMLAAHDKYQLLIPERVAFYQTILDAQERE